MRFTSKGKGPLELPRLTNIGPLSGPSKQIGKLVFRGSNIEDFNSDEFQDNTIDGRPVDIWVLDTAAIVERYDLDTETATGRHREAYFNLAASKTDAEESLIDEFRIGKPDLNEFNVDTGNKSVPIKSLSRNGLVARHISEQVTGGISSRLGAGFRFAGTGGTSLEKNAPLVLFLEKNRIPARLTKVEYADKFINEHPELAGAADSGGMMVMAPSLKENFELGEFTAWYGVNRREESVKELRRENKLIEDIKNDDLLLQWFSNPLQNFKKLEPEQELFAHTNEIDLDHSLFAVCFYATQRRLDRFYENEVGDSENVSLKRKTSVIHEEVQRRMIANSERLVTCVFDGGLRTKDRRIKRSKFRFVYDGESFTSDYNQAIPFTDPRRF